MFSELSFIFLLFLFLLFIILLLDSSSYGILIDIIWSHSKCDKERWCVGIIALSCSESTNRWTGGREELWGHANVDGSLHDDILFHYFKEL